MKIMIFTKNICMQIISNFLWNIVKCEANGVAGVQLVARRKLNCLLLMEVIRRLDCTSVRLSLPAATRADCFTFRLCRMRVIAACTRLDFYYS